MSDEHQAQLFRWGPNFSYPAGDKLSLIANHNQSHQTLLPRLLLELFSSCSSFKPMKDHVHACWTKLPLLKKRKYLKVLVEFYSEQFGEVIVSFNGFERMLTSVFEKLAHEEFFISWGIFSGWAHSGGSGQHPGPIASIGLITRNRVESLKDSLTSYIENSRKWNRSNDFLVFDDSPDEKTRNEYRDVLRTLKEKFKVPILYAGHEEKRQFADALIQAGLPSTVVDFSIFDVYRFGMTYGLNRNAFLLHSVGDMVFSADDDTVCRIAPAPTYKEGLQIGSKGDPYEMFNYPDRTSSLNSVTFTERDVLSVHEEGLGKTIGQCIQEVSRMELLDLENMNFHLTKFLQKGEGKILVTLNGSVGDGGSNSPIPVLFSSEKNREHLFKSEENYRSALRSREGCKANERWNITRSGGLMTTFLGMDNRDVLPPFFPVFRMEDMIFGEMIRVCQPDSCFAYAPWVLVHAPKENRLHAPEQLQPEEPFWPNDAIATALHGFKPGFGKEDMGPMLKRVGEHLMNFGSMPFPEYKEMMREYRRIALAEKITRYEELLKKHPQSPSYWKKDVLRIIDLARKSALATITLAPALLIQQLGLEESEKLIQKLVYQFGEVVKWWPDMVQASKELRCRGTRLALTVA